MKPPLTPSDDREEFAYVRSLVVEELFIIESYFARKYPNGCPFVADAEDLRCLDAVEIEMRKRIEEGREKYPEWDDFAISGLAATVRMSLMMRFKRVERTIEKLPDWSMLVEDVIAAGEGLSKPEIPANVVHLPKRPHLRLVKTVPLKDGK